MSKTKSGGSTRLGRDSESKRLGIKVHDGQKIGAGMIIVRQRGSKYLAGPNTKRGADDTIYALKQGVVQFRTKAKKTYDRSRRTASIVSVNPVKRL